MADDAQDQETKTEQPTQRRLEDAQKRGQVVHSKEVGHFLMFLVIAFTIAWMSPFILQHIKLLLLPFIVSPEEFPIDARSVGHIMRDTFTGGLLALLVPITAAVVAAIASGLLQHGFIISAEPIRPSLDKISIRKGLKRMFSLRSLIEFFKGILKLIIVAWVAWMAVASELHKITGLPDLPVESILLFLMMLATRLMIGVCVAMFFIALLDYLYQRFEYIKGLRMSKQEMKDEYKQQEGDPIIKQRLRQLRIERARKRMMQAVPSADVVITNPTHYSIALQYDAVTMRAPKVVAKGLDHLALKIREIARDNNIPLVENPPLARALYGAVEIDQEIPFEHYKAVAEIISYVYRVKGKVPLTR